MPFNLKTLFFYLILLSSPLHASSLIIWGNEIPSETDQAKIDELLRSYTGPTAKHFVNNPGIANHPHFAFLFGDEPFAEAKLMRRVLKQNFSYPLDALTIPSTLWDITVARLFLTDKEKQREYIDIDKKNDKKRKIRRYFEISNLIAQSLMGTGADLQAMKDLVIKNLRMIKENKSDNFETWSTALINEYEKISDGKPSLLLEIMDEEYLAAQKNKFLIMRATRGIPLDLDNLEKGRLLSFPFGMRIIDSGIDNFAKTVKENPIKPKNFNFISGDISYGSSFLGGFLYDSFNRSTKSACSFVFYTLKQADIIYTLQLDKKWLYIENGNKIIHFGGLYTDTIFGEGEEFHPRIRKIRSGLTRKSSKKAFSHSIMFSDLIPYDDRSRFGDIITLDSDSERARDAKIIGQYFLEITHLLGKSRIIAIGDDVFTTPNETREAQTIVQHQINAFKTLKEQLTQPEAEPAPAPTSTPRQNADEAA